MKNYKALWVILIITLTATFTLLGFAGVEVYRNVPPVPTAFVDEAGNTIISHDEIMQGQDAWQSTGGMEIGTVWGHGAYQAPDWTADWLHREAMAWLNIKAKAEFQKPYADLTSLQQDELKVELQHEYRHDNMQADGKVVLSPTRVEAIAEAGKYYSALYGDDPSMVKTRSDFAMKNNTLPNATDRAHLNDFFFWTSWAAATDRPGTDATYTNNWPHEPLINNVPTTENIMWSIACVVLLLVGIGFLIWGWAFLRNHQEDKVTPPDTDVIAGLALTPSQKALGKYVFLVVALFMAQIIIGGVVAHYTVEGQGFYGIDLSPYFPYSLLRTWHIQSALFWIATAFLAGGLFLAPVVNGGKDPKYQKLGVNALFIALLIVVIGSYLGNYFAIANPQPGTLTYWFGIQGYEYLDLGRFWQILLFIGFLLWLYLMLRAVIGGFKQNGDKNLLAIFTASFVAVGLFYGPGLFYGQHTSLSVMEYWRWWVVHLWVEGFFEIFATAAIAFIFTSLGLLDKRTATVGTLVSAILFAIGGVPGTLHHLYFSGTTTPIIAIGATFSALEVVPLIIMGYEAYDNWKLKTATPWAGKLTWAIYCFVAVAFWNMLGAGVFGFLINPPISLYYIQGLNTTAVHAHAALFGVYGFLALGFALAVLRYIRPDAELNPKWMKFGFWCLNLGIVLMILTSLLPIGIYQAAASISHGLWYARSEGFMQQGFLQFLRWFRIVGDTVFILGAFAFFMQVTLALLNRKNVKA
ncbi:nitric oxide reductase large subunit [Actinobacillus delphinicola]|uniref:Nitric oxide reductase large subunit n=1 Tax=Actinobacillus delphinicola TaxID=51161 RepID=A0A448TU48_9PAST|nr:nitric-oxide reductase large subunit [Actinobacillus delphinicola]MDG6897389.1 nitric oxide reductase large subunit [Actinobacillus delphinicola]VEJ09445.1 nitric oxide reductase large subunit [Actinobacillus delphinicola]